MNGFYGGGFQDTGKRPANIRVDSDVAEYFTKLANKREITLQALINETLREVMALPDGTVSLDDLHRELSQVIAQESK